MQTSFPALRRAGWKGIEDLPRIQKSHRKTALAAFEVVPSVMRIQCATSNGEQRVQVLNILVQ